MRGKKRILYAEWITRVPKEEGGKRKAEDGKVEGGIRDDGFVVVINVQDDNDAGRRLCLLMRVKGRTRHVSHKEEESLLLHSRLLSRSKVRRETKGKERRANRMLDVITYSKGGGGFRLNSAEFPGLLVTATNHQHVHVHVHVHVHPLAVQLKFGFKLAPYFLLSTAQLAAGGWRLAGHPPVESSRLSSLRLLPSRCLALNLFLFN